MSRNQGARVFDAGMPLHQAFKQITEDREQSGQQAKQGEAPKIRTWVGEVKEAMASLNMDTAFSERNVNEGFSGGEKKRNEIFQMAMLEPKLAILDETDSGLDIDALRIVSNGVNKLKSEKTATIVVTHYQRLLDYIVPDFVHVLYKGRIVKSGTKELALELEEKGYDWIKEEVDSTATV